MEDTTLERERLDEADLLIWEFDLQPPPLRSGMVFRTDLVDRIARTEADVITVVAPAGFGKTTTLTQWARTATLPVAWLRLSDADNDVRGFLLRLDSAIARARSDTSHDPSRVVLTDVESGLSPSNDRLLLNVLFKLDQAVLVLDNAHVVRSKASVDVMKELVSRLEGRARIVISSRAEPKLPLPALRSGGRLIEVTETDLALRPEDVHQLLEESDGGLASDANRLAEITGGWPAAISLLLHGPETGSGHAWPADGIHERVLADYVRAEILPAMSKERRSFLRRLAPLERVCGPLSDAVTGSANGSDLLARIATSTHLLHPVEGTGSWYEMNRVLRRVLERELEESDPAAVKTAHARAAAWYKAHDLPLEAIGHAQRAGDKKNFVDLMKRLVKQRYAEGHVADVLLWMDWLQQNVPLDKQPNLAAIGALVHMQEGNVLETERWLDAAGREPMDPDTGAVVWMVRAGMARSGVAQMLADCDTALSLAQPGSRWVPAILATTGLAHLMDDDVDAAERSFIAAATTALENGSLASAVVALGQRALIAVARNDWDLGSQLAHEALTLIDANGFDGYHISGPALIAAARCARHHNDIASTNTLLARASLARPRLSAAFPGESVQVLLELAKTYVELSDVVGARALVREAGDIISQRPDLGVLPDQLEVLKATLNSLGPGTVGMSALTKAELRLLPYLATNLSFPEIGERLFISRHTVKTQAMSIYRKLGTSSRSDAVSKAYETGLLQR